MNKIISAVLFSLIGLCSSCDTNSDINDSTQANTIKFSPQDRSTVFIEDIADTSFFRILSTDNDFLLSHIREIYFSDSLMIIPQRREGIVYLYDLKGNPVRKINPIGRSAGKLSYTTDVWYNENSKLIDIFDASLQKVNTYDLAGELVEERKIENAETGVAEMRFARSKNMLVFERLNAGKDNSMRLGIYSPDLKFQKSILPIPEKVKNVNFGRTHIFEVYSDSMYYLPFLETRIYAVSPEGISTAYEFDVPKSNRAPDEYLNGPGKEFSEYFAEIGTTDFIHSFDMLYMTDKYISFNYNKGGHVSRNNVFFSKESKNVLQFSNLKSKALPGMELRHLVKGVKGDYFVFAIHPSHNPYLPESIQKELNENSNPVLMFFKLKDF